VDRDLCIFFLPCLINKIYNCRNVRRCINATGRLSTSNSSSPPSLNGSTPSTPTGILSSSSRPSQPPPTVVHHRGAYYTILRPTSRRTDVCSIYIHIKKNENFACVFILCDLMLRMAQLIFFLL
jgi:hypothetical protein